MQVGLITVVLLYIIISISRKHRLYIGNNGPKYRTQLEAILKGLPILHTLKWRTRNDIVLQVEDALLASVREWFNFVLDRIPTQEKSQNGRMTNLTRMTHVLMGGGKSAVPGNVLGKSEYRLCGDSLQRV